MAKSISPKITSPGKRGHMPLMQPEEQDFKTIFELARQGKSLRIIAARIGISHQLLDVWLGNNKAAIHRAIPEVRAAWEAGLVEYEDSLASVLHKNAFNDDSRMQVTAAMFLLKAKCKWRENDPIVNIDVTQKAPNKFKIKNITPIDIDNEVEQG